ncbi:MAG: hypothetical protein AAFY56_01810 [Pseudomonadota bacterium]
MRYADVSLQGSDLGKAFRGAAAKPFSKSKASAAAPFSIRFTREERERMQAEAGQQPLGAYIRSRLLGETADKRRVSRRPRIDQEVTARLLAELGKSRLASNMNQLAKAANTGTLDLGPEVARDIRSACAAITDMRVALISALGVKPERG